MDYLAIGFEIERLSRRTVRVYIRKLMVDINILHRTVETHQTSRLYGGDIIF